ncbi:MAG: class I SAM-dependent methyltransferase [Brevinematales bacterium]|nr:class I SAM-dependent methyltransferase [Brevinematales bacterium]
MSNTQSFFYNAFYSGDSDPSAIRDFFRWLLGRKRPGGKLNIADIGCGTGRMLQLLAEDGHSVTGYEPDGQYYQAAKELENGNIHVIQKGFTEIDGENCYDAILAINGPYEYLQTVDERALALEKCGRALKPGGLLFIEVINFPLILKNYKPLDDTTVEVNGDTIVRHARHEFDFVKCVMRHYDHFDRYRNGVKIDEADKLHSFGIFTYAEMIYLLERHGFGEFETYNSFDARKPEALNNSRIRLSAVKIS